MRWRQIGWQSEVFDMSAWDGVVVNPGAWLQIDGRKVHVVYRDLDIGERDRNAIPRNSQRPQGLPLSVVTLLRVAG
jgi:hypothetical protein